MLNSSKITAIANLHARLSGLEPFAEATVLKVFKDGARQSTFLVEQSGTPVVLKLFHGADAAKTVSRAQAELKRLAVTMSTGRYQINRCLGAYPDRGLIVLSYVDGPRVHDLLKRANPQERAELIAGAGHWLGHLCGPHQRRSGLGPDWWIAKREAASLSELGANDRACLVNLLAWMAATAPALKGYQLTKAASHGDFVSINLMKSGPVFYGVDIQGRTEIPVARDVARFLVWLQLKTPLERARLIHGLAVADLYAFLSSGILNDEEARQVLPFFIADQLFGRVLELARLGADLAGAYRSVDNLISGAQPW